MTNAICKFYTSSGELLEITTNNLQAMKQLLNEQENTEYTAAMIIDELNRLKRMVHEFDVRMLESCLQFYGKKLVNFLIDETSLYEITLQAKNGSAADLLLEQGQWYDEEQLQRISDRLLLAIEQKDTLCIQQRINQISEVQYGPLILQAIKSESFDVLKTMIDSINDPIIQNKVVQETTLISQLVPGNTGNTFRTALKGMCRYQQQETSLFNAETLAEITQLVSIENINDQIKETKETKETIEAVSSIESQQVHQAINEVEQLEGIDSPELRQSIEEDEVTEAVGEVEESIEVEDKIHHEPELKTQAVVEIAEQQAVANETTVDCKVESNPATEQAEQALKQEKTA